MATARAAAVAAIWLEDYLDAHVGIGGPTSYGANELRPATGLAKRYQEGWAAWA